MPPTHLQQWETHHGERSDYPYLWRHKTTKQWVGVNHREAYDGEDFGGYVIEAWNADFTYFATVDTSTRKKSARKKAVQKVRGTPGGYVYRGPGHPNVLATMEPTDFPINENVTLRMRVPSPPSDDEIDSAQLPV